MTLTYFLISLFCSTVPCPPTNVQSVVNCSTNSASVSWDASVNALSYRGTAVGRDGHTVMCQVSAPGCQFNDLHCGQEYVFIITASDGTCGSPNSQEHRHETGYTLKELYILFSLSQLFVHFLQCEVCFSHSSALCTPECVQLLGLCI